MSFAETRKGTLGSVPVDKRGRRVQGRTQIITMGLRQDVCSMGFYEIPILDGLDLIVAYFDKLTRP